MKTNRVDVVSAIIVKNGMILAVKRTNETKYFPGMMSFPGGKRDEGETIFEGVKREVFEETGYTINQVNPEIYTGKAVRDGVTASFYIIKCQIVGRKKVEKGKNTERKVWVKPKTLLNSLVKHHFYTELINATERYFKQEGLL